MSKYKPNNTLEILTPNGFESFTGIQKVKHKKYVHIIFNDQTELKCSLDHKLLTKVYGYQEAKNLHICDDIQHDGIDDKFIKHIKIINKKIALYDIVDSGKDHNFYSNGVISHNCNFLGSSNTLISGAFLRTMVFKPPIFENDNLDIYEAPKKGHVYTLMADTAHGVSQDYSLIIVIDITDHPYKVVAKYRSNVISPYLFPDVIYKVATDYNECYVLIEVNDIGYAIANSLYHELEYVNMMMCIMKGRLGQQVSQGFGKNVLLGVKTTKQVKRIGCKILKTLVENHQLLIEDLDIISEFSTFVVNAGLYAADEGYNDDLVMCLVLFGWLTTQKFFKELANADLRKALHSGEISAVENALTPFGVISNGLGKKDPEKMAGSDDAWFMNDEREDQREPDGIYTIWGY